MKFESFIFEPEEDRMLRDDKTVYRNHVELEEWVVEKKYYAVCTCARLGYPCLGVSKVLRRGWSLLRCHVA